MIVSFTRNTLVSSIGNMIGIGSSKLRYYNLSLLVLKRYMFKSALKVTSLTSKVSQKTFYRHPSFVAEGTMLMKNDYQDLRKILYFHNQYLFNLKSFENIDFHTFQFYKDLMLTNPKIFQHILSVAYPNAKYSLHDLKNHFPQLNIDNGKNELYATEDVIVAAVAGNIMKQNQIFKNGSLTVLSCDYDPLNKKEKLNEMAFAQTKQNHPDYLYVYKPLDKNTGIWYRHYDFKSGKFNINSGHIFCVSNKEEYEKKVAHHLHAQHQLYESELELDITYNAILNNPQLTWSQRNNEIQLFFKDNLYKFPHINPSFILHNSVIYEIDNITIPKHLNYPIIESCVASVENTQIMLAETIYKGGHTCRDHYLKHPYNSPIIISLIKKMIAENTELL